jgi:hypothetical protein
LRMDWAARPLTRAISGELDASAPGVSRSSAFPAVPSWNLNPLRLPVSPPVRWVC